MPLIDRPWTRVREPVPIPEAFTVTDLLEMAEVDFAELIRSHLVPRDQSAAGRRAWDQLWTVLKSDDALADRTYDVLDVFLDTTGEALESGDLDDAETKRAEKFGTQCLQGWKRIDRKQDDHPLAWAGSAGQFQPSARRVIATLIRAIARHRSAVQHSRLGPTPPDEELWAVMRRVNLDPDDYAPKEKS